MSKALAIATLLLLTMGCGSVGTIVREPRTVVTVRTSVNTSMGSGPAKAISVAPAAAHVSRITRDICGNVYDEQGVAFHYPLYECDDASFWALRTAF